MSPEHWDERRRIVAERLVWLDARYPPIRSPMTITTMPRGSTDDDHERRRFCPTPSELADGLEYEREKITGSIDEQAEAHRRLNAIVGDLQLDLAERRGISLPLNTRVVKQNLPSKLRRR